MKNSPAYLSALHSMASLLLVTTLAACGGGGNGASETPKLIISEVASNFSPDDSAWLEIYNPSDTAIDLAGYQLRTGSTGADPTLPKTFTLPSVAVPARGLVVVAGEVLVTSWAKNNAQIVYVHDNYISPYWNANGFVELIKDGVTADFVRFGNSAVAPLTTSKWNGSNVAALPSGALEYGKSIVRPMKGGVMAANRRSAADWVLVNFATPAGINDIAAGVIDSDGDGIPDSAKFAGGTYGGLDLYAMGARPGQRDIFMQIDYMKEPEGRSEPMLKPRRKALQKVVDAFANSPTSGKPYALHIDVGNLYSPTFSPADFNLGGGKEVPFHPCLSVPSLEYHYRPTNCATIFDYKSAGFDVRRRLAFHYAVFGNSQKEEGTADSSGIAEINGNDFIVTLGNMSAAGGTTNFPADTPTQEQLLINTQASTLMHEFGHNLGLGHGGDEYGINFKPNYISIMNYLHQMTGIGASLTDGTAADRYLLQTQSKTTPKFTLCDLTDGNPLGLTTITNSPCTAAFKIDYSNGKGAPLDEANIDEALNVGRGSIDGGYADWNHNGLLDTALSYQRSLNPDHYNIDSPPSGPRILRDFNDWDNLVLPFARHFDGSNNGIGSHRRTASVSVNPMHLQPRDVIVESAPTLLYQHIALEKSRRQRERRDDPAPRAAGHCTGGLDRRGQCRRAADRRLAPGRTADRARGAAATGWPALDAAVRGWGNRARAAVAILSAAALRPATRQRRAASAASRPAQPAGADPDGRTTALAGDGARQPAPWRVVRRLAAAAGTGKVAGAARRTARTAERRTGQAAAPDGGRRRLVLLPAGRTGAGVAESCAGTGTGAAARLGDATPGVLPQSVQAITPARAGIPE